MKKKYTNGLVYSTGPMVHDQEEISRPKPQAGPVEAIIHIERKGRGGKTVTVIELRGMDNQQVKQYGKKLKSALGSGGTTRDNIIEIQGEHRQKAAEYFESLSIRVKK